MKHQGFMNRDVLQPSSRHYSVGSTSTAIQQTRSCVVIWIVRYNHCSKYYKSYAQTKVVCPRIDTSNSRSTHYPHGVENAEPNLHSIYSSDHSQRPQQQQQQQSKRTRAYRGALFHAREHAFRGAVVRWGHP